MERRDDKNRVTTRISDCITTTCLPSMTNILV